MAANVQDPLHPDRADYYNRRCRLGDGRDIGCAVFGQPHKYVATVIFFHGTPGSRLDAAYLDGAAKSLKIRLLAFDRPGLGNSTPKPNRIISDFAKDVNELLSRYFRSPDVYLLGYSNGTAYALATAQILPRKQVRGLTIVAGLPPWNIAKRALGKSKVAAARVIRSIPGALAAPVDLLVGRAARSRNPIYFESIMKQWMKRLNEDRKRLYASEGTRRIFVEAKKAAYRNPAAIFQDVSLLSNDWGIELENVPVKTISMWYGDKDIVTPYTVGKDLQKQLPGAVLHKIDDADHQSIIVHHGERILGDLVWPVGKHGRV